MLERGAESSAVAMKPSVMEVERRGDVILPMRAVNLRG